MSHPLRRLLVAAVGAALACGASGCATSLSGLQFHNDHRMKIVSPSENEKVATPFTVRWTMKDFTVAGESAAPASNDTGFFAVFVDRSPVRPGQTLAAVGHNDPGCGNPKLCLTRSYLASKQVYTTTTDRVTLPTVADIAGNNQSTQFHTATVVLMNTSGARIGESAWSVEFKLHAAGGAD